MSLMDKWWGCSDDNWSIKSKNLSVVPVSSLLSVSDSELSSRPVSKQTAAVTKYFFKQEQNQ